MPGERSSTNAICEDRVLARSMRRMSRCLPDDPRYRIPWIPCAIFNNFMLGWRLKLIFEVPLMVVYPIYYHTYQSDFHYELILTLLLELGGVFPGAQTSFVIKIPAGYKVDHTPLSLFYPTVFSAKNSATHAPKLEWTPRKLGKCGRRFAVMDRRCVCGKASWPFLKYCIVRLVSQVLFHAFKLYSWERDGSRKSLWEGLFRMGAPSMGALPPPKILSPDFENSDFVHLFWGAPYHVFFLQK